MYLKHIIIATLPGDAEVEQAVERLRKFINSEIKC